MRSISITRSLRPSGVLLTAGVCVAISLGACADSRSSSNKRVMSRRVAPAQMPERGSPRETAAASLSLREREEPVRHTDIPTRPSLVTTAQLREHSIGILMDLVKNGLPEEKANALEGLRFADGRLSQVAGDALHDPAPGVRGVAALALAKARSCGLSDEVSLLLSDRSPIVRASAMLSLWRCGNRVDPTPLAAMLNSSNPRERAQAAWVLGEMGERSAVALLRDAAKQTVRRASLGANRAVDLQIAEARVKLGDDEALSEIRTALLPARNEDLEATALAAQIAGDLQDREATNALIGLVEFKDSEGKPMPPEVRLAAVAALAKLGQPKGGAIAVEYTGAAKPEIRSQAVLALGVMRNPEYLPTMEKMLDDPSGQVRAAAAMAILQASDPRSGH